MLKYRSARLAAVSTTTLLLVGCGRDTRPYENFRGRVEMNDHHALTNTYVSVDKMTVAITVVSADGIVMAADSPTIISSGALST